MFWSENRQPRKLQDQLNPLIKIQLKHLILSFTILCIGLVAAFFMFAREICKYEYAQYTVIHNDFQHD